MSTEPSLNRRRPTRPLISLVPMIDVMLILLVFFMVTSTYLNLDMIPALAQSDRPAASGTSGEPASAVVIRIGSDGAPYFRGQALTSEALESLLSDRIAQAPATPVIVLPTGSARMQALVTVMDVVTRAGVTNMRVVRLEARP
ncbi:biopolymer transporter ExbD [Ruegeria sp. R13_0]|uniref:ExbD/TolR family protein n=1 Tax=Ruegeria sp. R13_0 TaxID=2821099 RepID=UPI001ADD5E3E|nr:biopolymer transporter ExbD [Ruegeria sp. R13_0]MBO9434992.1 biopolymer transporter ExbD [Ruegeria sp. R13_0]